ncbi:MAG: monovalent cation/H+ antiporter subunit D family protein [Betaproteobacteria bacterium]
MIDAHLPVLQVVVPLVSAPLIVLFRNARAGWLIAVAASTFSLGSAIAILLDVQAAGVISYAIGNWPPPWGIEYRIDAVNSFLLVLLGVVATVVALYARTSVAAEVPEEQRYLFYAMYCLCLAGLAGITVTGDAFNVFVFLEISSLSSYVLIALARDRRALLAAYQYLILGTIGATFIVIGVGLLYLVTGTLNIRDIATRIGAVEGTRPVLAALAFLTVGISLKAALFPLHMWLPGAYAYAPSATSSFLAATATKVSLYVLLRFYFSVFGATYVFGALPMSNILLGLSLAAMFIASAAACFQSDLKRVLAYSSVAQVGYITLGISFASKTGLTAGIVHLFNHGVTKGALFMLVGAAAFRLRGVRLADMGGLARSMPITCAGIVLGGLSLIGVPGTVGFVTKWYLVLAALESGAWWIAFMPVASSLLAVVYVWRFVEVAYFRTPSEHVARLHEAPPGLLVPAGLLLVAVVYFGVDPTLTVDAAARAAASLLGEAR